MTISTRKSDHTKNWILHFPFRLEWNARRFGRVRERKWKERDRAQFWNAKNQSNQAESLRNGKKSWNLMLLYNGLYCSIERFCRMMLRQMIFIWIFFCTIEVILFFSNRSFFSLSLLLLPILLLFLLLLPLLLLLLLFSMLLLLLLLLWEKRCITMKCPKQ